MAAEAARFEMLSTMEKTQFGIEQAASLFSTLGAQNKKAFEASKALNIASAIMNTYMGATKALATYPWPFGLIAAAAAVYPVPARLVVMDLYDGGLTDSELAARNLHGVPEAGINRMRLRWEHDWKAGNPNPPRW